MENEDLAHSTAQRKGKDIITNARIPFNKGDCLRQLVGSAVHAHPLPDRRSGDVRGGKEVCCREEGLKKVMRTHHLRSRIRFEGGKDVVLCAVCDAIEQQIDREQEKTPVHVLFLRRHALFGGMLRSFGHIFRLMKREECNAKGDKNNNGIFIQRVALPEHRNMQRHHREEFARLRQDESNIVDVIQTFVAER